MACLINALILPDIRLLGGMAKFPNLPLSDSIVHLGRLFSEIGTMEVDGVSASSALGHESHSGAARAKLAAMNAYGLIQRSKKNIRISKIGLNISQPLDGSRARGLHDAALNPDLFRAIHAEGYGSFNENLLSTTLVHKYNDFQPDEAKKAARIFKANFEFAGLDALGNNEADDEAIPEANRPSHSGSTDGESPKQVVSPPQPTIHGTTHQTEVIAEFSAPLSGNQLKLSIVGSDRVSLDDIGDIEFAVQYLKRQLERQIKKEAINERPSALVEAVHTARENLEIEQPAAE